MKSAFSISGRDSAPRCPDPAARRPYRNRLWFVFSFIVLYSSICVSAFGQYTLQRSSFSTIGGKSTGGTYSLRSAVGTPAVGAAAGGSFSVKSTPWNLLVVQTPGAPLLSILITNNTALVSWPSPSTGFVLQENTNSLASSNWVEHPFPQDNGTIKYMIVNPPAGNRFYRLFKP